VQETSSDLLKSISIPLDSIILFSIIIFTILTIYIFNNIIDYRTNKYSELVNIKNNINELKDKELPSILKYNQNSDVENILLSYPTIISKSKLIGIGGIAMLSLAFSGFLNTYQKQNFPNVFSTSKQKLLEQHQSNKNLIFKNHENRITTTKADYKLSYYYNSSINNFDSTSYKILEGNNLEYFIF
tara:strand:- start:189 stop:746 length:558 start_codon:yes stop_codon:yes gene_type:complete